MQATIPAPAAAVKVIFDSRAPRAPRPFGRLPQRGRRLPIGPSASDLDAYMAMVPCPSSAPTDAECEARREATTASVDDFRAARRELAEMDRLRDALAELATPTADGGPADPSEVQALEVEAADLSRSWDRMSRRELDDLYAAQASALGYLTI